MAQSQQEFTISVYSKSVKSSSSDGWLETKVIVDEQSRSVILNLEKKKSSPIGSSLSLGSRQNSTDSAKVNSPMAIQLVDYRVPKLKLAKNLTMRNAVELRSKMTVVGSRMFQFHTSNEEVFNRFFAILSRVHSSTQRRPSVNRSGLLSGTPVSVRNPAMPVQQAAAESDPDPFCSDYATVTNVGSIIYEGEIPFIDIESDIYEVFDEQSCFAAYFDDFESNGGVPKPHVINKGDEVHLYVAHNQLELLANDSKQVLCAWPFTQIKRVGHSAQLVRLVFGTRSSSGTTTLSFRFSERPGGSRSDQTPETAGFICRLVPKIRGGPAACGCRCQQPRGGQQRRRRRGDLDDATEDEDDDDQDPDEEPAAEATAAASEVTPGAAAVEDGVYATVQHAPDSNETAPAALQQQQPQQPPVPPHPPTSSIKSRPPPPPLPTTSPGSAASASPQKPQQPPPPPPPTVSSTSPEPSFATMPRSPLPPTPSPPAVLPKPAKEARALLRQSTPRSPTTLRPVEVGEPIGGDSDMSDGEHPELGVRV